jgi:hypothetical protein
LYYKKGDNMSRIYVGGFLSLEKVVTPKEFLGIVKSNPQSIKHVKFIPPVLGDRNDFGKIKVEYHHVGKK